MQVELADLGFSLAGKTCLVTGAGRGLGEHLSHVLAKAGASYIAILDRDGASAAETAKSVTTASARPVKVSSHACDITDEQSVAAVFAEVVAATGQLDVVVNAAGIPAVYPALTHPLASVQGVLSINVTGSLIVARQAALAMKSTKSTGSIILVASMSAFVVNIPQPQAVYNASKSAVKHLASSLAVEWAPFGIRVNSISPGYLETEQTNYVESAIKEVWIQRTPLGRLGKPKDIGGPIVFLASDASEYMTGADLRVDGGYSTM